MLRRLVLIIVLAVFSLPAVASHLMGGEITWDCVGGGNYVFTLKLYRDCNGSILGSSPSLTVTGHPSVFTIPLTLVAQNDISPGCNSSGPTISCAAAEAAPGWPSSSSTVAGAVQESVFTSAPVSLPGVPPSTGWIFTFDECCRNPAVTNLLSPSTFGITLRAVMYPYSGMDASPCFDSSPKFLESPGSVICLGYPFTYNHNAFDPEQDSLSYSWAQPYSQIDGTIFNPPVDPEPGAFAAGYSFSSPLPGTAQNSANVPATINPSTGEISFTSFTQGNFVTVVKVEAWKCGQLVAEIYREMQIVLLPCATNNPPAVVFTSYQDTVYAGQIVSFTLTGNDAGLLADGITPQSVNISATGNQFGTSFGTTGCANPPCASLSPAPASGVGTASTSFNWETSCAHIANAGNCNDNSNTYTFVFKTRDDFCPAPAEKISTVSITVLALPQVPSPVLHCASVLPGGDAQISWTPPLDPDTSFDAYMIYSSGSASGPFTLIDSIFTIGQNSYTDAGANADAAPVYYYVRTRSGCGSLAAAADTISTMHLNVFNPSNGTAVLSWNPISSPLPTTASGTYNIYIEFPAGTWSLSGSTTLTNFVDTINVCNAFLSYRIEMSDASGCTSISSVDTGTFQNIIVPSIPVIDTLSVDDNNLAQLNWNQSPSPDTEAYIIYRYNGSGWVPVDTVYGITNTSYSYLLSTAGTASEDFRLAAFDSCGNISPLGEPRSTIYLSSTAEICERAAVLSWNAYGAIGNGEGGYRVWMSTGGTPGSYVLAGTAPAGSTSYTVSSLLPLSTYYFFVQAIDLAGVTTASSNRISFYSDIPVPPDFSYLRKASVTAPNQITITAHVDVAASTQKYKIMRSLDATGPFVLAGSVTAGSTNPISFTDTKVLTDKLSYYYKIITVDSCGFDGLESNIGRSILLTAISDSPNWTNQLSWNDYESWSGNVLSYNIYRGVDGVFDNTPIATVPYTGSGTNSYTDDVSMLLQGVGQFSYYVEAVEGPGNIYGFGESSFSNVAEAYQDAHVFVPNAFVPSGINNVFRPVTTYVDLSDYQLMVFNRWGLKVFESTDQNEGWDGSYKGGKSEQGAYVYLLRYKDSRGEHIELKGTVTLIR